MPAEDQPTTSAALPQRAPSPAGRTLLVRFAPTATTYAVTLPPHAAATARSLAAALLAAVGWGGRLAPDALVSERRRGGTGRCDAHTRALSLSLFSSFQSLNLFSPPPLLSPQSITSAGAPLHPASPLPPALPLTLYASLARPLPGGGGDGGSTGAECRAAYLEMYRAARPDALDPAEAARMRTTLCRLSGELLVAPVVVDDLGRLYNKDALVRALLASKSGGGNAGGDAKAPAALPPHISSLKHVTDAVLTLADGEGDGTGDAGAPRFACPVTGAPMAGRARFVLLRPGGLVVAERALAVAPAAVREAAGGGWEGQPLLLNPSGEEEAAARAALLAKRAGEAARRAAKRGKRGAVEEGEDAAAAAKKRAKAAPAAAAADDEAAARAARLKATLALAPDGADKGVFASLFTSSKAPVRETFASRGR